MQYNNFRETPKDCFVDRITETNCRPVSKTTRLASECVKNQYSISILHHISVVECYMDAVNIECVIRKSSQFDRHKLFEVPLSGALESYQMIFAG
jgi:hypothetical protein